MSDQNNPNTQLSNDELEDLVASTDTGGRQPSNPKIVKMMAGVALFWSLLQIWYSAPFSYARGFGVFNSGEMRSIHLAFAIGLAFLAYPAFKNSPAPAHPGGGLGAGHWSGRSVPFILFLFNTEFVGSIVGTRLSDRPNAANQMDVIVSVDGRAPAAAGSDKRAPWARR